MSDLRSFSYVFVFFGLWMLLLAGSNTVSAQAWELVWADEFDGTEVDQVRWSFQRGDGTEVGLPAGWGNNERQWYQADNAAVADGFLTITAREEQVNGYPYTSARLRTLGKGEWTYGRFEMRARLPIGQGLWPAFWMLPSDPSIYGGWAASGEIDIMESIGSEPSRVLGTIHYGAPFPGNVFSSTDYFLNAGTFNDDFHVFAVEWLPGEIRWFVDGEQYATRATWYSTGGAFPAPFDVDFHLLLNLAVGGNLPGNPDASTVFPQTYVVDYVRVYALNNEAPTVSITEPADGATIVPGDDLQITIAAADTDGNVANVEVFQGDAVIGTLDPGATTYTVEDIAEGCYTLRARATDDVGIATFSVPVSVTVGSCTQAPYLMTPLPVPGFVEAEQYDLGGEGVAYHDIDPDTNNGNASGNTYRMQEGVDLEYTADAQGGHNVSWIEDGEWLAYTVAVEEAGSYTIDLRVASESNGGVVRLLFDGGDATGPVPFGPTGGWQNWTTKRVTGVMLEAGVQTMRVSIDDGSFNLNWIRFANETASPGVSIVFDDMEHGDPFGSGWFQFNGDVGGGGIGAEAFDLPPPPDDGAYSLGVGFGGAAGYIGGFGREYLLDLSDVTHFNFWINPDPDQAYTLEFNLQDDDNGDGSIPFPSPDDDEFQYNCVVGPSGPCAISGGGWQLVSIPFTDFFDDNSIHQGNNVFDLVSQANGGNGGLVNIVVAIIGTGTDAEFRTDNWGFSDGLLTTAVEAQEVPGASIQSTVFPNPFRREAFLQLSVDQTQHVKVHLYDLLGRTVAILHDGVLTGQAEHAISIDGSGLSGGLYFYRIEGEGFVERGSVVLAK